MSLPKPPKRTAFHTNRDGNYKYTVMPADLHLTGKFKRTDVIIGRFVSTVPNSEEISRKPGKNPEKVD